LGEALLANRYPLIVNRHSGVWDFVHEGPADCADKRRKIQKHKGLKEGTKLHEGISFVLLGVFFASFVRLDFSFITKGNIYFLFNEALTSKKRLTIN
jgi:hypothetical protein